MNIQYIDSLHSTNTWLKENPEAVPPMTMLVAHEQTAGRGQRGNSWEAAPGCNLTLSFHYRPEGVRPAAQFAISEAVALAVADTLRGFGFEPKVKWPNDLYVGDSKIAGILIEHTIAGSDIARTIAGIGLNVNQERFTSDAPNPVSMLMLAGHPFDLGEVLRRLGDALERRLRMVSADFPRLHTDYIRSLWRNDGALHPFRRVADGLRFDARILMVEPSGMLLLQPADDSEPLSFAFKEVEWLMCD